MTKEELLKVYNYEIPANNTEVTLNKYNGKKYTKKVVALIKELDMEFVVVARNYNEDKSPQIGYDERKK